jgi:short-subunit dehydrogenase
MPAKQLDLKKYGPWALIAGGSESLGASLAGILAASGINLVLIARKQGPLEKVAASLRARDGIQVRTLSLDLTSNDVLARVRGVTDDIEIGLVIYNAGAAHRTGPFLEGTLEDALRTVGTNALGYVQFAHHFGKRMVDRSIGGGFLTIGSMAAVAGTPGVAAYTASKAFGQFLAEALWSEWKPHRIDVLHVMLGAVNSPSMARIGIVYGPEMKPVDPDQEAQIILDNLANGPIYIHEQDLDTFREFQRLSRREAAETTAARLRDITGVTHQAK